MNLHVEDLAVCLGGTRVLEDVSTTVPEGSLVGLVGPNGAGKTTLLRTINATLDPDSGRVTVGGAEVHALDSQAVSRRVATVPQDTAISFDFSVRQVVEMGRYPHRSRFGADPDPEAVERAMERAAVADLADRSIDAVSGGERQRVVLARALAQDAPVLVLDEPTASLDVNHQVATLDLVRELVADGRSALAAIHDLNLAARYCDRIVLLAEGSILAAGDPGEVLTESAIGSAFGADAVVTDHPVTGSPLVTALGSGGDRTGTEAVGPGTGEDGTVRENVRSDADRGRPDEIPEPAED